MLRKLVATAVAAALAGAFGVATRGADGVAQAAPVTPEPVRIMPLGDSVTYGLGSKTRSSYRTDLQRQLAAAGVDADFVGSQRSGSGPDTDNEGHGGWTIRRIAAELTGWLDTYQPDVVLLHLGTNDMAVRDDVAAAPQRLSDLVDQIRAARPTAEIFVQRIVGSRKPWLQALIDDYNAQLPAVLAGKDAQVHLVDQSGIRGINLFDMVHPNEFGYAKMAHNLYSAMSKVLGPWPAVTSPYTWTKAWICRWTAGVTECRWWYHRALATGARAVPATAAKAWQTPRVVAVAYGKHKRKIRYVTRWSLT
ncbi:SGNH/GDSL hydrolase family protein [Spirilliplanes yamanashiensis]|uniref:SGNH hydrolase-type esterase domain-containing protein n=1 Tax=Spirilliplanes yamanashiensis TaxID=42233 RepID=A0A8J3Y6J6_9ACTN|nr:SGNH/GDSL hydrolase family protein [Spirilliplanes yamanashiensis]MDP9815136.1 lysophospholipase L1-like esterase [Spirilliplanes yamanashiensis]GIJ02791.1 hypothetical protein Sya03_21430 [Spirilliplanes yamanashiensis]